MLEIKLMCLSGVTCISTDSLQLAYTIRGVARHVNECRHKVCGEGSGGRW